MNLGRQSLLAEALSSYFQQWQQDVQRAEELVKSKYCLEGILVLSAYIGALGSLRYPKEKKDWKAYKDVVRNYSGLMDIYENIDLLLFYQFPRSILKDDSLYKKLKNYDDILKIFYEEFGDEFTIKENRVMRYCKRDHLKDIIGEKQTGWFDNQNFDENIELFSNNHILYKFVRCQAVHNKGFHLINRGVSAETSQDVYEDNHQITRDVILRTANNIVENLKEECLSKNMWPERL